MAEPERDRGGHQVQRVAHPAVAPRRQLTRSMSSLIA
jgi:hypothetical protein